jgi:hypothetical protein
VACQEFGLNDFCETKAFPKACRQTSAQAAYVSTTTAEALIANGQSGGLWIFVICARPVFTTC